MRSLLVALLLVWPLAVHAALPAAALNAAGVKLPPNARLPLTLVAHDLSGRRVSIADALAGKSGFVLFADYTCKTLCGPALVLLSAALTEGAVAPDGYRLIVIGLDPKDSASDARRMMLSQLPAQLRPNASFLLPDRQTRDAATSALGFSFAYDRSVDQFAHPEVVYAVAQDGRVQRLLSPLSLTTQDLQNAFSGTAAPEQSVYSTLRVLCYRFGILTGVNDATVALILKLAAGLLLAAMSGAFIFLVKRKRPEWT